MKFKPMLVPSGALPPDSEKWSYEVKSEGFRALIHASGNGDHQHQPRHDRPLAQSLCLSGHNDDRKSARAR